jgi:hypothetical protein
VATQGNPSGNQDYVKMYKIQYSTDGLEWDFYKENYKQVKHKKRVMIFIQDAARDMFRKFLFQESDIMIFEEEH